MHGDWRTAPRLYGSRARHLIAPLSDRLVAGRFAAPTGFMLLARRWLVRLVRRAIADRWTCTSKFAEYSPFLEDDPVPFPAHPRVVFVGVLERYKGVDVLLDAWPVVLAQVPRAELVIAGDGTMDAALRRRVSTGSGYPQAWSSSGTYLQFGCVRYWTTHGA